ncbi:MAG: hypothetical protein NUW23_14060 [Firmicutes bacterium]|jgi:hypothetical protein|nr:hypothetical protein [Bacillota bacterium]
MRPRARMTFNVLDTVPVAYVEHEGAARRVSMDSCDAFDVPRRLLWPAGFGVEIYIDSAPDRSSGTARNTQMGPSTCGT